MSALSPPPAPNVPDDPAAVRIVLFGMPDAGKSSLLGALAQAAHTQGRALHGSLTDVSHGLGELRNRLYDDHPRETQQEIVAYSVRFAPAGQSAFGATLFDCDGRTANDFLTRKRALEPKAEPGTLAWAILNADALVLTVDASAGHEQIEGDFREFRRFLDHLEDYRQEQHAVGGLPVFLVLTKCDLLGRETLSRAEWEARIAERTKEVAKRFQEFLGSHGNLLAFGTLNLEVRATAVRRPALADAAPQPREPFGVAELFHEAFVDARTFRYRSRRSHKRLVWTVGGAAGFLGAMLTAGAIFLTTTSRQTELTLADRVAELRAAEGPTATARLSEGLDRRMSQWLAVQADPGYPQLPPELKAFVQSRLEEGQAYVHYRDDLAAIEPPATARSLAELTSIEQRLNRLTPPAQYQAEWAGTDAVRDRDRLLTTELPALRQAVTALTQFYFTLKNRVANLLSVAELGPDWDQRVHATENADRDLPFPRTDPARGPAFEFDDVTVARTDWEHARDRLTRLRDLAAAVGLLGEDPAKAPLALMPVAGTEVLSAASRRWLSLKSLYPEHAKWSLAQVPDAVRPEIERRLRASVSQATRDGQRLILDKLKALNTSGNEEPADWPRIGEYLLSPPTADWRELTGFLTRLLDPSAEDPVQATATFVRRTSFDLNPQRVRVRIPDTLSDAPVRPTGNLVFVHHEAGRDPVRIALKPEGDPQRDKQSVVYTFAGVGEFIYRPGDTFYTELQVRKADRDLRLTWSSSRTRSYQFESLTREPRMHAPDESNVEGIAAEGVVTTVAEGKLPAVPAMIPVVRFDGK